MLALGDYEFLDHVPRHFEPSPDSLGMPNPQIQLYSNYCFNGPFLPILLWFLYSHADWEIQTSIHACLLSKHSPSNFLHLYPIKLAFFSLEED